MNVSSDFAVKYVEMTGLPSVNPDSTAKQD